MIIIDDNNTCLTCGAYFQGNGFCVNGHLEPPFNDYNSFKQYVSEEWESGYINELIEDGYIIEKAFDGVYECESRVFEYRHLTEEEFIEKFKNKE